MNKYITINISEKIELQTKLIEFKHISDDISKYEDYSDLYKSLVKSEITAIENMISYMEEHNLEEIMTIGNQIVPVEFYSALDKLSKNAKYI